MEFKKFLPNFGTMFWRIYSPDLLWYSLLSTEKEKHQKKLNEVESKLQKQTISEAEAAKAKLTKEELAKQEEEFRKKEAALEKKDKETPWNVDTLSKDGFSKTILNKLVTN